MNRDDIIRMAREAGGQGLASRDFINIERFAALVAAAEREACVELCVKLAVGGGFAADCAAAIRARGEQ